MKKYILLLVLLLVVSADGISQLWKLRRIELTGGFGTTHFMGDVGGFTEGKNYLGFRDISLLNTGFNANLGVGYRITADLSVRADFTGGNFSADDIRGSNPRRGFNATMTFFEASLVGEFFFIKNKMEDRYLFIRGKSTPRYPGIYYFDLYAFAGFGGLTYKINPNTLLADNLTGSTGSIAVVPVGIGIARNFPRNSKLGLELGRRFALSDELDGYSAPGSRLDVYYFFDITYTWKVRTQRFPSF